MGVQEYIAKREEGKKLNDTVVHNLMKAYLQLEERLTDEKGLIDHQKLKGEQGKNLRQEASRAAYETLKRQALAHYGATTEDVGRQEDLIFGLFGFYGGSLDDYLEEREERVSSSDFMQYIAEKTPAFRFFHGQRMQGKPQKELSDKDASEVVRYSKTEGLVDPNKLGIEDMAGLLNQFIEENVITPSFLRDKDYRIKEEDKKKIAVPAAEHQAAA